MDTVFTWIVAAATIYFSLAGVRLLIKSDYYTRAAIINFKDHARTSFLRAVTEKSYTGNIG